MRSTSSTVDGFVDKMTESPWVNLYVKSKVWDKAPQGSALIFGDARIYLQHTQLAKFIGPMAGFHRHFHRPAVGNRWRADIGFAHRRDSGPLAANGRLEAAGRQKAAFTFLIIYNLLCSI